MANRRMFALNVVDTDLFLDLPVSTQALYFHMGMRADDDGFVAAPRRVASYVGCGIDDLKLLITKGFLIQFDTGVCVITDWKRNNQIRADRYTPGTHVYEKSLIEIYDQRKDGFGGRYRLVGETTEPPEMVTKMVTNLDDKMVTTKGTAEKKRIEENRKEEKNRSAVPAQPSVDDLLEEFDAPLQESLRQWFAYKKERKEAYKPVGLKSFLTRIRKAVDAYGTDTVCEQIENSMASGWKGVFFDKVNKSAINRNTGKKGYSDEESLFDR